MPGGFLNHCHPEQSEGAKRPTARPRARSRGVSHSRTPSFNVVILSEVRRSAATERESKDPASLSIITTMSGNSHRTS
jgi:hypothetical protein